MTPAQHAKGTLCPFLGMKTDATSHMAFPSPLNYCTCCSPSAAVNLKHQAEFCLDEEYSGCVVYIAGEGKRLPKQLRLRSTQRSGASISPLAYTIPVVLIAAGVLYWNFRPRLERVTPVATHLPAGSATLPMEQMVAQTLTALSTAQASLLLPLDTATSDLHGLTPSATVTVTPFPTLTDTPTITPTATTTATMTPMPTETGTPIPPFSLDVPIGGTQKFVIHNVAVGENTSSLAEKYGTSVEAIQSINYMLPSPIWAGLTIVIPLGVKDPDGLLVLEPYHVPTDRMSIEDIAFLENADLQLLLKYNDCDYGQRFRADAWILIPRPPED